MYGVEWVGAMWYIGGHILLVSGTLSNVRWLGQTSFHIFLSVVPYTIKSYSASMDLAALTLTPKQFSICFSATSFRITSAPPKPQLPLYLIILVFATFTDASFSNNPFKIITKFYSFSLVPANTVVLPANNSWHTCYVLSLPYSLLMSRHIQKKLCTMNNYVRL